MLCIYAIAFLAALGQVELFKIRHQSNAGGSQLDGQYPLPAYLAQAQLQQQQQPYLEQQAEFAGVKNAQDAPLMRYQPSNYQMPMFPMAQPQALAYIIVRPLQTQYQLPMEQHQHGRYYSAPQQHPIRQHLAATKGGSEEVQQEQIRAEEQHPVKGALEQTLRQPYLEQHQQQQLATPANVPTKQGKFLKLKESLDRLAASAKSKLTLGSYELVSEEIVQQEQDQQQQQQQQQEDIKLTHQEQEAIQETEHQDRLEANKGSLNQQREEAQVKGERGHQQEQAKGQHELAKGQQELAKGQQELAKGQQELAKEQQEQLPQLQQAQQVKSQADESFGELRREQKRL